MTRYKVIVNPTSGRGRGEKAYPQIENTLHGLNLDFEICRTEAPLHAIDLAKAASTEGFDVVVAAGGDGTTNEVLNGLSRARLEGRGTAALGLIRFISRSHVLGKCHHGVLKTVNSNISSLSGSPTTFSQLHQTIDQLVSHHSL